MPVRALKALVIGMAVVIVIGFGVVVATIAQRLSGMARQDGELIGNIALPMAETGRLEAVTQLEGALLAVRLSGPRTHGCESILLVDLESATVVGRLQASEMDSLAPTN